MAGVLYGLRGWIAKVKPLHGLLIHLNKETTPYYAVHPFYFGLISALVMYVPFSAIGCVGLMPVVWGLCYLTIVLWNRRKKKHIT